MVWGVCVGGYVCGSGAVCVLMGCVGGYVCECVVVVGCECVWGGVYMCGGGVCVVVGCVCSGGVCVGGYVCGGSGRVCVCVVCDTWGGGGSSPTDFSRGLGPFALLVLNEEGTMRFILPAAFCM